LKIRANRTFFIDIHIFDNIFTSTADSELENSAALVSLMTRVSRPSGSIFTPSLLPYITMYDKQLTLRGFELHLQFIYNDEELFHTIVHPGSPPEKIILRSRPEAEGASMVGVLTAGEDFENYSLSVEDRDVLTAHFVRGERRGVPKSMTVQW
jgi:hypothetical protein